MQISILGAGWLGFPLGKVLLKAGHTVKASTTSVEKKASIEAAGMQAYQLTVDSEGQLEGFGDFFTADVLILTLPPKGRRDPQVGERYPRQIQAIVNAARTGGCRRIIFTSSTSVYGEQEGPVDESSPLLPSTSSGRALRLVEDELRSIADLQVTILRLAGLAGPDRHPGRWFAGKTDLTNGHQRVNMVHLNDVIGIVRAILDQGAWDYTFNVCADEHPTKADFYRQATLDYGGTPPQFSKSPSVKTGKLVRNSKVKEVLHYQFAYPDPCGFRY